MSWVSFGKGLGFWAVLGVATVFTAQVQAQEERIVTLGSSVTEIVHALGEGDKLVARDTSSTYPAEVMSLPEVGYYRSISAEGVLSQNPTLVLTTSDAGPPEALAQLRQTGVELVVVPEKKTLDGVSDKIRAVAEALEVPEKGQELVDQLESRVAEARELAGAHEGKPKVLFLMQIDGAGAAMAAGQETGVDEMLRQAGAENAAADLTGYRDMSLEAILAANPDVILLPEHVFATGKERLDGLLGQTKAGEQGQVHTVDLAALAGFGPRAGDALADLVKLIYPQT